MKYGYGSNQKVTEICMKIGLKELKKFVIYLNNTTGYSNIILIILES